MTEVFATLDNVVAVLVTYGERYELLVKAIGGLKREGLNRAVVVNNGSTYGVRAKIAEDFGSFAVVVECPTNMGSAPGFALGIQYAIDHSAEYILLLDDDNVPRPHAIYKLLAQYNKIRADGRGADNLIAAAYRPEHYQSLEKISDVKDVFPNNNSFFSFHLKDLGAKVGRRMPLVSSFYKRRIISLDGLKGIPLFAAPYSGMLFHRKVIERHGKPKEDLILYADDVEFAYRISSSGGLVWLALDAPIDDLELSWSHSKKFKSSFSALLNGEGEFRAFYSTRNLAWFESHRRAHNAFIRSINKYSYLAVLLVLAIFWRRLGRARLLIDAIRDGEAQRLGIKPGFPLR